jgi:hypothetical protein
MVTITTHKTMPTGQFMTQPASTQNRFAQRIGDSCSQRSGDDEREPECHDGVEVKRQCATPRKANRKAKIAAVAR